MKKGLKKIILLLDKSQSMKKIQLETISGVNEFLSEQIESDNDIQFTLVTFNSYTNLVFQSVDIKSITPLSDRNYTPSGMTALLDAIGTTIKDVGFRLSQMEEHERPEKVIFVIYTDGEENCSSLYNYEEINKMIKHQEEKYNWTFMFLASNIDVNEYSNKLGINKDCVSSVDFDGDSSRLMYSSLSKSISTGIKTGSYSIENHITASGDNQNG
ncbi:MAG: vWA domain-containing protein [Syntrophothermus sp.]